MLTWHTPKGRGVSYTYSARDIWLTFYVSGYRARASMSPSRTLRRVASVMGDA